MNQFSVYLTDITISKRLGAGNSIFEAPANTAIKVLDLPTRRDVPLGFG
jgi:hypothetical protein